VVRSGILKRGPPGFFCLASLRELGMATVSSMVGRSSMGSGSRGSVKSGKSAPSGIPKGLGAIDEMQEVATGTIAARPAMPARKSKMRNTAPSVGGQSNSEVSV
jgi:hypothetical protein